MSNSVEWISVKDRLPESSDSFLVTLKMDWSYKKGTGIELVVCEAYYNPCGGYLQLIQNLPGGFDTYNDWDEGQPIEIVAWAEMPEPYKGE